MCQRDARSATVGHLEVITVNMNSLRLITLGCVLLVLISGCYSIRCHSCWTKDNEECLNSETLGEPEECGRKQNVCKKVVTKAFRVIKRGRGATYSVISNVTSRLCGQADWRGCFTMEGASSISIQCACDTHGCNSSPITSVTIATVTMATFLGWIIAAASS